MERIYRLEVQQYYYLKGILPLSKHVHQHISASSNSIVWWMRPEPLKQYKHLKSCLFSGKAYGWRFISFIAPSHFLMGNSSCILWDSPPFVPTGLPGHETQPFDFCCFTICLCLICIGRVSHFRSYDRTPFHPLVNISVIISLTLIRLLQACTMLTTMWNPQ